MHPAQPGSHHSNRVRTVLICTAEWIDAGRMPVNQQPPTWPMATTHTFSVMPSVSDPDDTVQRWVTGGRCERSLSGLACPTDRCLARSRWHHKYNSKVQQQPRRASTVAKPWRGPTGTITIHRNPRAEFGTKRSQVQTLSPRHRAGSMTSRDKFEPIGLVFHSVRSGFPWSVSCLRWCSKCWVP
jgi:hypothetical protein